MLKDLLDFALENGVDDNYAVSGLFIEGPTCTIFSMRKPIPKLYHMEQIRSFDLPMKVSELEKLNTVVDSIIICHCRSHKL
ncbi:hypothetical protein EDC94DRAFT_628257 [Helicostylum pulchrum]|nr:hypothetical protein EDC94DRAFT_628257 [Helicostylum pulchrum]